MTVLYQPSQYWCEEHGKPVIKLASSKSIWHCPADVAPCGAKRFYLGAVSLTRHDLILVEEFRHPAPRR